MDRKLSGELNVSPWEAMIAEVRRAAYRAAWVDERLENEADREAEIMSDDSPLEFEDEAGREGMRQRLGSSMRAWLEESRRERAHMAKVSADAVRAGLAERHLESVRVESQIIARVLRRALNAAELTPEQEARAAAELRAALMDESRGTGTQPPEIGQ